MADGWQIIEDHNYFVSLRMINEDVSSLDTAIALVDYALSRNPRGFTAVLQDEGIYIAKTKFIITPEEFIPALRLWFRVIDTAREVHKLWIELCPADEMSF
jgi:hypothetical protein